MRPLLWPLLLAAACAVVLLMALLQVLHAAARQAEARSRAASADADAVWRCNYMSGAGQRESCHLQRATSRRISAML